MLGVGGGPIVARARAVLEFDDRAVDKGLKASESKLQKFGEVGTAAALGVGVAMAAGAKQAIDAASDLDEQMNKSSVVFGKHGEDVQKWADGASKSFGQSKRQALEFAGTFGNMLRPMGFAEKAAASMSKRMVELGSDMASFNNASPEETLQALRAGLSGETEPLRRFGVSLNQARIEAEALSSGLVKADVDLVKVRSTQIAVEAATRKAAEALKEHGKNSIEYRDAVVGIDIAEQRLEKAMAGKVPTLTAAQKAQATYNVILKDTKLQQNDFANTADNAANKQRTLAAQIEDTKAKLGAGLLPVYQSFLGALSQGVGWLSDNTRVAKILAGVIAGLAGAIIAINGAYKVYIAYTRAAAAAQAILNAVVAANPFVRIALLIVALGTALVVAYKKSETFRKIVHGTFAAVRRIVGEVLGFIIRQVDAWLGLMSSVLSHMGWVPKFGGKMKEAGASIDRAREKMRDFGDTVKGTPSKKEVNVDVKVKFTSVGQATRYYATRTGDGIVGAIDAGVNGMIGNADWDKMAPSFEDSLALGGIPIPGAGSAPRREVTPGLWDELGIAAKLGLAVTSTYRPGAITSTGNRSNHGVFPSHAVDISDGTSAGQNSPRMRALFRAVIGRPGISEVILSPLWWHPGSGVQRISSSSVMSGHWNHVHIGTSSGDGRARATRATGRRNRFSGDGIIDAAGGGRRTKRRKNARGGYGTKGRPVRPPRLGKRVASFDTPELRDLTGEAEVDSLVTLYNTAEKGRSRLEAEFGTREGEYASDDTPLIITRTATDPVTGEEYEYDEVDFAAVSREAEQAADLIDLQRQIQAKTAEIKALAERLVTRIRETAEKLKGQAGLALGLATGEEKKRDRWKGDAKRLRARVKTLRDALAHERGKKKPSKAVIRDLLGDIGRAEGDLRIAETEAGFRESQREQYAKDAEAIGERADSLLPRAEEFDDAAFSEGQRFRQIETAIRGMEKDKAAIEGTAIDPDRGATPPSGRPGWVDPKVDSGGSGGSEGGGEGGSGVGMTAARDTRAGIAAEVAAQTKAARQTSYEIFTREASNLFSSRTAALGPTSSRDRDFGAPRSASVTVHNYFTQAPEDPAPFMSRTRLAAQAAFSG